MIVFGCLKGITNCVFNGGNRWVGMFCDSRHFHNLIDVTLAVSVFGFEFRIVNETIVRDSHTLPFEVNSDCLGCQRYNAVGAVNFVWDIGLCVVVRLFLRCLRPNRRSLNKYIITFFKKGRCLTERSTWRFYSAHDLEDRASICRTRQRGAQIQARIMWLEGVISPSVV